MTKCNKCGKEVGNLFCGHCRAELEGKWKAEAEKYEKKDLIPLIYWVKKAKMYRVGCMCFGCPANVDGICQLFYDSLDDIDFHEFDGDNIVRTLCG